LLQLDSINEPNPQQNESACMTLQVGILGFAHGHVNAYCNQWTQNPDYAIKVAAGWDHDAARLAKQAETYGLQPFDSLDAFLAQPDIQAVVIGAETSMHADLVERAAAAGKMIALQKPISLTLDEADRIVAAVQRYRVPFTLAWQMRVDPQNIAIKELIERGEVGRLLMVRRRHGLPSQLWDISNMWHFDPALNRDIWADDSAHPIDFIHWLLGVPESVMAELSSKFHPQAPNANGVAIFRYADGLIAEVSCSFSCLAAENTTEVIGEKGSIIQNYGDVPSCNVPRPVDAVGLKWYVADKKDWTESDIPTPANHGARIAALAGPLAEFFHGKRPPLATAEEGRTSLRMTLACYLSNQEGRRVRIDDERIRSI
jgi:predicted dehydrogenase